MTFEEGDDDGREWRSDAEPDDIDMIECFDLDGALKAGDCDAAVARLAVWLGLVDVGELFGLRAQWNEAYLRGFVNGATDDDPSL